MVDTDDTKRTTATDNAKGMAYKLPICMLKMAQWHKYDINF